MNDLILIIDDDTTLLGILAEHLLKAGYRAIQAESGITGLQAFYENHPDLVILDVMMPRMDGWTVCERLREVSDVPVLLLTAKGEERDLLRGFRLGVDDYVVKPFSFAELVARVGAILARSRRGAMNEKQKPVVCNGLVIDLEKRQVTLHGELVHLTPTEFRLLAVLAEHLGTPVSTETLQERVWGDDTLQDTENVKSYIHYLRQKLEADPEHPQLIRNERGFGYYLA